MYKVPEEFCIIRAPRPGVAYPVPTTVSPEGIDTDAVAETPELDVSQRE
jgi:hypothetical protein